jgi:hypothetical protein
VRKLYTALILILLYEDTYTDLDFLISYNTDTDLSKPVDNPPHPNRLAKGD